MIENLINEIEYNNFKNTWNVKLINTFSEYEYENEIIKFVSDEKLWLKHSFEVYKKSMYLRWNIDENIIDEFVIEYLAIFHDIWKFFQEIHSLENISIAENLFKNFAYINWLNKDIIEKVLDWIKWSDFYNHRLDPSWNPPKFIEWNIVRCSDKIQDNLVSKVDRYWFEYWVPRWAIFYDNKILLKEREKFSFDNFLWDQLNVILSIIWLRSEDFSNDFLSQEYEKWNIPEKQKVIDRILELAKEIWYSENELKEINKIIIWYRKKFNC